MPRRQGQPGRRYHRPPQCRGSVDLHGHHQSHWSRRFLHRKLGINQKVSKISVAQEKSNTGDVVALALLRVDKSLICHANALEVLGLLCSLLFAERF